MSQHQGCGAPESSGWFAGGWLRVDLSHIPTPGMWGTRDWWENQLFSECVVRASIGNRRCCIGFLFEAEMRRQLVAAAGCCPLGFDFYGALLAGGVVVEA